MAALKGTFFAFRRRERGGVLTRATLVHALLLLALFVIFAAFLWFMQPTEPLANPSQYNERLLLNLAGAFAFALLHSIITASYEAACLRWLIRSETMGFGGFSLSGDTWRVYAGYWVWFAASFGVWFVVAVVSALSIAAFNLANYPGAQDWVGFTVVAFWILAIAPFALRMSPGNAASISKRKFSYFEGAKVSSGRRWALAGSFLMAWVFWVILFIASFFGAVLLIFMAAGGQPDSGSGTNTMSAMAIVASVGCANLVLAFLSAGVNARAVIAAAEEGKIEGVGTNVAGVFD